MMTTIQISKDTKKLLDGFGLKGDSYDTIVRRIYEIAAQEQLKELLFSPKSRPVSEALRDAEKEWPE